MSNTSMRKNWRKDTPPYPSKYPCDYLEAAKADLACIYRKIYHL